MAAAPKDRQALCVALVRDGKLITERWFAAGEPVRVGRWPRNHFVLSDGAAPGRQTLFDGRRQGHALCVIHDLHGRLSLEDATPTVDELCPGGADHFDLPPGARGRLQLHGATLLFKVVPEPLAASYLARTWRASLLEDEPVFHTFLTGFSAVASVVMAGLYNVQPVEMSIDSAPPAVTAAYFALPVPVIEQPLPPDESSSSRARRGDDRRDDEQAAARTERPRDLASETRLRSAFLRLLDGRGEFAREGVLASTDDIFERTRLSLEHVTSVEVAGLVSEVRGGQGLRPTEGTAGDLVDGGGGTSKIADDQPSGPRHRVVLQADEQGSTSSAEAQAMKAIHGYARTIGACYERALNKDPQLSGRLVLTLYVVAGRVMSAEVEENRTGDLALGDCAVGAARRWRLPAEAEGEFPVPYLLTPG